jgi:hypothetical protein
LVAIFLSHHMTPARTCVLNLSLAGGALTVQLLTQCLHLGPCLGSLSQCRVPHTVQLLIQRLNLGVCLRHLSQCRVLQRSQFGGERKLSIERGGRVGGVTLRGLSEVRLMREKQVWGR